MLPATALSLRPTGAHRYGPQYLTSRDEVWLRHALGEYEGRVGLRVAELDHAWRDRVEPALVAAGARRVAVHGIKCILDRGRLSELRASIAPREVRRTVFELAAELKDREQTLAIAAQRLNADPTVLLELLYADRAGARTVGRARRERSPAELSLDYNLAMVQGLLLRSSRLELRVGEHIRPVVRFAKLQGLLVEAHEDRGEARLIVSGPLSLFRRTMKYGHALARFFPTVMSVPQFEMQVECTVREEPRTFFVTHQDPLPRTHALPREYDSKLERALVRDIRRLGGEWTLARETALIHSEGHTFFPDFTLIRGERRVLVEIVGFYTADYLHRKLRTFASAKLPAPTILCIDESLDCGQALPSELRVLRFKKRIDAGELLRAAEEALSAATSSNERERQSLSTSAG